MQAEIDYIKLYFSLILTVILYKIIVYLSKILKKSYQPISYLCLIFYWLLSAKFNFDKNKLIHIRFYLMFNFISKPIFQIKM